MSITRLLRGPFEIEDEGPPEPPSGQIHECGTCGKREVWGMDWLWFGSYKQLDEQGARGVEPIFKACSIECMEKRGEAEANRKHREALAALKAEEEAHAERLEWLRQKRDRALTTADQTGGRKT